MNIIMNFPQSCKFFEYSTDQGCTNPGHLVDQSTKFCVVYMGPQLNLYHITFLVSGILRCPLDFWNIRGPLSVT